MSELLPTGYTFVGETEISARELMELLEAVASVNAHQEGAPQVDNPGVEDTDFSSKDIKILELATGVRDKYGELVGYASARIDRRDEHAIVDTLLVQPLDQDRGIGRAIVQEGLQRLSLYSVESVSFEPFGSINKLLPFLILQAGFGYDDARLEYRSQQMGVLDTFDALDFTDVPDEPPLQSDMEHLSQEIGEDEIVNLQRTIDFLIRTSKEFYRSTRMRPYLFNDFVFEIGGIEITLSKREKEDSTSWQINEGITVELPAVPTGISMAVDKTYAVEVYQDEGTVQRAFYDEVHEIQGKDGSMLPFTPSSEIKSSNTFSHARYRQIMAILHRLTPEDLLIDYDL